MVSWVGTCLRNPQHPLRISNCLVRTARGCCTNSHFSIAPSCPTAPEQEGLVLAGKCEHLLASQDIVVLSSLTWVQRRDDPCEQTEKRDVLRDSRAHASIRETTPHLGLIVGMGQSKNLVSHAHLAHRSAICVLTPGERTAMAPICN